MRTYVASASGQSFVFHVRGERVVWASSNAQWAMGKPLGFVRGWFKSRGAAFYETKVGK